MRRKEQKNLLWFWFDESVKQREAIINISSDEMKKLTYEIFSPQWLLWAACTLPIFNRVEYKINLLFAFCCCFLSLLISLLNNCLYMIVISYVLT